MDQSLSRRTLMQGIAAGTVASAVGSRALAQEATPIPTTAGVSSSGPITIFEARKIVTLHDVVPEATHVAVRDGRVLGAGTLENLTGWGEYTLDETFKDLVIVPGLIEAHSHPYEGLLATLPYVGYFDRPAVDGSILPGVTSYEALIAALKEVETTLTDPTTPLLAMGFDPIYFWDGEPFSRATLDQVSSTRQIGVWYASEHVLMLNTPALAANDITAATTQAGVVKDAQGAPTGQLNEQPAMSLVKTMYDTLLELAGKASTWEAFGQFALNAGCTMVTDMSSNILASPEFQQTMNATVNAPGYPVRVGVYVNPTVAPTVTPDTIAGLVQRLRQTDETEMLRFPGVKLVLDGSIQSFTAYMDWPGYYKGPNDQQELLISAEELLGWITPLQEAGIQMSAHCNGDATVELFLDAIEAVTTKTAAPNARHTCQHSQLTTPAQYERMATLGVCANIFANQLWYWGDQHYEITVGPERAEGMEACATALANGIPFSVHTDASVTPLGCLHTMWCAVNRVTPKGRVLGEAEKISAEEALRAVTLGSAYLLGLDEDLGSIETGKWADFTVLAESPLDVDPLAIKDIKVWGTVLAGVKQPGAGASALV